MPSTSQAECFLPSVFEQRLGGSDFTGRETVPSPYREVGTHAGARDDDTRSQITDQSFFSSRLTAEGVYQGTRGYMAGEHGEGRNERDGCVINNG